MHSVLSGGALVLQPVSGKILLPTHLPKISLRLENVVQVDVGIGIDQRRADNGVLSRIARVNLHRDKKVEHGYARRTNGGDSAMGERVAPPLHISLRETTNHHGRCCSLTPQR